MAKDIFGKERTTPLKTTSRVAQMLKTAIEEHNLVRIDQITTHLRFVLGLEYVAQWELVHELCPTMELADWDSILCDLDYLESNAA